MSNPTFAAQSSTVVATHTVDGVLVRLDGAFDADSAPALRTALLSVRPAGCDDVIIDAGGVTTVDDDALAVLLAAGAWAVDTGARLGFSRMSDCLRTEIASLDISMLLPMLAPAGERVARPMRLAAAR
ncbi:MAG: anti-sigma factor antagonist [Frankiales bacterium]|jgi:anti-anti-sigma regulatory factor|nr:anti-sigma factor antagonist [Frankiales bacterium]MDX6210757.1 anti-sigma factor antagonist [Frankiales bacterium]MDX6213354.1 anti-sigma factor antagonist [Frankiales bacterium]